MLRSVLKPVVAVGKTRPVLKSISSSYFHSSSVLSEKVLCVLYPDPSTGYPPKYPRGSIPTISMYPDGMTTPSPNRIDYTPGELLGSISGGLGLRKFLEDAGHEFVVTSDKDGKG